MKELHLPISGMHCRSCELLLEEALLAVPKVGKVEVSQKRGVATISYEVEPPKADLLEQAVRTAGYAVGVNKKRPWFSKNPTDYLELFLAAGSLFVLYVIFRWLNLADLGAAFGNRQGYGIVFLVGLTAGVSTCMALIGGLVLGLSAEHKKKHPEATRAQNFRPHIFFNLGRILGFVVLGGIIGALGSIFQLSSTFLGLFVAGAGLIMLFLGLKLVGIFPRLEGKNFALPKWLSRMFGLRSEVKEYSHRGAMLTGALTFFLPCGFTQAMQIYAVSTGSFISGAVIMGLFALGTAPGLLGIGGLAAAVKGSFARIFFKFAGVLVLVFGLWNVRSGWNLTGVVFSKGSPKIVEEDVLPTAKVQEVRMTQKAYGYSPNQFTIKKGVPVRWIVTSENAYTCASFLTIPALQIYTRLLPGENVIEFTPTKTGPLVFTCSMGMYSGRFNVVE